MKDYKYDIAISLCKEDVQFARKLVRALNPKLDVFFYEDRQEELIGKIGPEEFGKVFRERARVVVVLFREAWGESYYTELERDAIISRTAKSDEGLGFICMVPLEKGKVPSWYPSSRIYVSPFNFSIKDIARFLEFKVTERDGVVEPMTFEDRLENFEQKVEDRESYIRFLQSPDSVPQVEEELHSLIDSFNAQIEQIREAKIPFETAFSPLHLPEFQFHANGLIKLGFDRLQMIIRKQRLNHGNLRNSQGVRVELNLSERGPHSAIWSEGTPTAYRFNSNGEQLHGWSAVRSIDKERNGHLLPYLFYDNGSVYNLAEIVTTDQLITEWMVRLFRKAEQAYEMVL